MGIQAKKANAHTPRNNVLDPTKLCLFNGVRKTIVLKKKSTRCKDEFQRVIYPS